MANYLPRLGIKPAAVNLSIGSDITYSGWCDNLDPTYTAPISYLRNTLNIPVVIASGNGNSATGVSSPACISSATVVGNTTMVNGQDAVFGGVTSGSNSSGHVDLLAPGTDICSAIPTYLDRWGNADGWTCGIIGTSFAAPQVTGAIAVLKQKRPNATASSVLSRLAKSGSDGGVAVTDTRVSGQR